MSEYVAHTKIILGSNRSFGFVFLVIFSAIGFWPLTNGSEIRVWALVIAVLFGLIALFAPKFLGPLNKLWFKLSLLLGAIISPIVISILFFIGIVPTGLIMRALGKDPLKQNFDKSCDSYWVVRDEPVGPMKNQF